MDDGVMGKREGRGRLQYDRLSGFRIAKSAVVSANRSIEPSVNDTMYLIPFTEVPGALLVGSGCLQNATP